MTSSVLISTHSSSLSSPQTTASNHLHPMSDQSASSTSEVIRQESMKPLYQADQQEKFLHLQAETEALLTQLQTLKQQKLTSSS